MNIILISGKAEAGKTTTANIIKEHLQNDHFPEYNVAIVPYGQYVKDTAKMLWGWNGKKDEAGRNLLQWWGTDVVRAQDEYFWVNTVICLSDVMQYHFDYLIVDDCRFPNEIEPWKSIYEDVTTIRVERPGHENCLTPEQRMHPSETSLDDYEFDVTLTATDTDELEEEIMYKVIPRI